MSIVRKGDSLPIRAHLDPSEEMFVRLRAGGPGGPDARCFLLDKANRPRAKPWVVSKFNRSSPYGWVVLGAGGGAGDEDGRLTLSKGPDGAGRIAASRPPDEAFRVNLSRLPDEVRKLDGWEKSPKITRCQR